MIHLYELVSCWLLWIGDLVVLVLMLTVVDFVALVAQMALVM